MCLFPQSTWQISMSLDKHTYSLREGASHYFPANSAPEIEYFAFAVVSWNTSMQHEHGNKYCSFDMLSNINLADNELLFF